MIFGRDKKKARQRMVEQQLRQRNITDERVLKAMQEVPRHRFVPEHLQNSAYTDGPLPIGDGQTISQPYIVAYMSQLLDLGPEDRALEIGTGSGYQAAILAHLAKRVYSVERIERLAEQARKTLRGIGINNVEVVVRDGSSGLPEHAPYAGIIVTAAAPQAPEPLKKQLADGGKMIIPVGSRGGQVLERWTRRGDEFEVDQLSPVAFVPLLGNHGWDQAQTLP
jgi:protein-L-isoaspartate(D-aspartate) O-methyltransferase